MYPPASDATMSFEKTFRLRVERLFNAFSSPDEGGGGFGDADTLVVATGIVDADDEVGYLKCYALMTWLTGSELQGAVMIMTSSAVTLAIAPKDVAVFKTLAGDGPGKCPAIAVLDTEKDAVALDEALGTAVGAETVAGLLVKEAKTQRGPMAEISKKALAKAKSQVNIAVGLAHLLAVKDAEEVAKIKKAAMLSSAVFRYALLERIEKTIDQDKKVSHASLSQVAEDAITTPSKVKVKGLKDDFCDPCYPPIVQSSSADTPKRVFDLKPSAESDSERLEFGVIISSLGARYSNMCSNISRTLLVDPTEEQKAAYSAVLRAHTAAVEALVPGAKLSEAYHAAVRKLKSSGAKNADALVAGIGKNVGFGTGIEYRDSAHLLNAKNETLVKEGMVFNVAVGSSNLKDNKNGSYALFLADTVHVRGGKLKPEVFTASAKKELTNISYELADSGDDVAEVEAGNTKAKAEPKREQGRRRSATVLEGGDLAEAKAEDEKRRKHQLQLEQRMLVRGRARLEGGDSGKGDGGEEKKRSLDEVVAYQSPKNFPNTKQRQITVDMDAEAIIVPINGMPVPFHISTIKNATKSDEGKHTYLRINFYLPQSATARTNVRAAMNAPLFPEFDKKGDMTQAFVKEMSFRSSNPQNLSDCLRKIKELVKRTTAHRTEAREAKTLVAQEKVRLTKGGRVPTISNCIIRPPLASGKNNRGTLEAHTNGFFYRGKTGQIEIAYGNVRNAFFQEADRETIVLVHFHLKNDIVVGKKKTRDIQFYVEVMDAAVRLNDTRRRQFDQDELEEEQREREMRNRTNKQFLKFTKQIEEAHDLEFDIPYRSLAFTGAPRSSAVTLLPTVNCIIDLIDWPCFVLNLQDVEIAHFERVNLQLRNFDLVFVFKSFLDSPESQSKATKDMWTRISAIESDSLNGIKKYLDEQELKYYEGPVSLAWNNVIKTIRGDPEDFYDNGGWRFLAEGVTGDGDGGESDGDSLEGDQEFKADSGDDSDDYSSEDSDDFSDSDASGDAKAELDVDSEEGEDDLSSEEEGLDWEEAERQARKADARRGEMSDDDNGGRRKGGRSSGGRSTGGARSGGGSSSKRNGSSGRNGPRSSGGSRGGGGGRSSGGGRSRGAGVGERRRR